MSLGVDWFMCVGLNWFYWFMNLIYGVIDFFVDYYIELYGFDCFFYFL